MKNVLIYSDPHICLSSIEECNLIFNEIIELSNKYSVDTVISLGDNFNTISPTALELNCLANFIKKLNRKMIILAAQSHESSTHEISSLDHYGILTDNVSIVREYIDEEYLYCGHFIINESKKNYGGSVPKSALEKYRYVVLGHGHSYEVIPKNICQLGAVRYVDFAEVNDKAKIVLLIENYRTESEKLSFLALKSSYPMKDVIVPPASSGEELQDKKWRLALDSLSPKTKVRLIFSDFSSYLNNANDLEKYKSKFTLFKIQKNFLTTELALQATKNESVNLRESLITFLNNNKISEQIKQVLLEELK